ncbi:autotransporter outer membrane beta-barrel domain-containing protein [Aliiroseovarius sp. Z3]|uniref:autotransporter domain-containing protein n=1 Tax=Aliiroseovarius sp. Z3 TaxID=2811402 RepID=UPI0023B274FF|nr:autotransporter outer membrane beta-barrel domain-containing protein [Aliiroseovarius sp. Z3]MDE9451893.1 autotransporter outer membrane beta-barrel domain-containing protein [Aliiroseovarius sp. Z3]MDE9452051.1 autotransporter outer membrane beta-barrel domain-containing protein [Aliiroseovarius sp. Z3]
MTSTSDVIDIEGTGTTISLEGGFPFELASGWTIEPQGQIIWQRLSMDEQSDAHSTVRFETHDAVTARLGVRMHGDFEAQGRRYLPYLKVNIWHEPDSDERIFYDGTPITTRIGGTSVEIGGGLVTELSETVSLYATADYRFDVDGGNRRAIDDSIGVSMKW